MIINLRLLARRAKLKYYEAGMDLGLSENKVTSFRLFQQRIINEYDAMVDEFGFTVQDGSLAVERALVLTDTAADAPVA